MALLQTATLRFCILMFLLTSTDCTVSIENYIPPQINRTAFQGETVVLHCNGSRDNVDIVWHKDGNRFFIHSLNINRTEANYTSNRMQVDPRNPRKLLISNVQLTDSGLYSCSPPKTLWILTITEKKSEPQLLYIVITVTGALAVCLCIICAVSICRKWKQKVVIDDNGEVYIAETGINHNQSSQYCERINSVYGHFQS